MKTNLLRHEFETAKQHLETLRQQTGLLLEQQGPLDQALLGLSDTLQSLQQAYADLSRRNEECSVLCQSLEAECAYYRDIFDNAPHARLLTDLYGAIEAANAHAAGLLRASQASLAGQQLVAFLPEQDHEVFRRHLAQLQNGQEVRDWEVRLEPGTGETVPVSLDIVPTFSSEHEIIGLHWLLRDITRQVCAEQALRKREQTFRSFVEQSQDGIALTDEQGCVLEWNRAMEESTGLPADDVVGQPIWDVQYRLNAEAERTPFRYEQLKAGIFDLLRSGHAPWLGQALEREYVRPDGVSRVLQGAIFPIKSDQGFLLGSITRDVTQRKRAEEERELLLAEATQERQRVEELSRTLAEERSTFQVVLESTHTQIAYLDLQFNFLFVNSAYAQGSGHTREELVGRGHFELFPNAANQAIFEKVRDTGQAARFFARPFEYADQPERGVSYWDWSLVPAKSKTGEVFALVLSLLDVTQQVESRLRVEALSTQAQQQASELTAVLNAIPESVAVWDIHGALLRANPASAAFGIGSLATDATLAVRQAEVRHPDGRTMAPEESVVAQTLRGETVLSQPEIFKNPAGEQREILASGAPVFSEGQVVAAVVVTHDVTEQRQIERERERLLAENRAQREFLERLLEAAPVGIAVLRGPDHRYELANPYYRGITGVLDTPMVGRTIVEVIPDLPKRGMPALMDQVYRTGETVSTREVQLSFGPGREETYWDTDRVPLRGPDGMVDGILVLAREVTQEVQNRRRIEDLSAQAQRQADEMAAVFAGLVEPLMVFDAEGAIVRANPAAVEALGIDPVGLPEAALSRKMSTRYLDGHPVPPDGLVAARALRGEKVRDEYQRLVTANGEEHAIVASAAPIVTGGQVSGAVVAWHDITDLRQAEEVIRQARDELELRVQERTADLMRVNEVLVAENQERMRIEAELRLSEQGLEQRVGERTDELATLLDISNTVALTLELEPLLTLIFERLRDVVDYDGGAAFRHEAGTLRPVFHRGPILPDDMSRIGTRLEGAFLGTPVISGPEPIIIADIQSEPTLQQAFWQAVGAKFEEIPKAIRAWMAVPVTIKEQVYGVLYMYHHQPGYYTEKQARLALAFGNQAAVAIENTRLYEHAQKLAAVEERQHLARELHDAVSQTLFSASLAADVLPRLWERDREAGLRCLSEVQQLTRGALAEMRTLLLELRPTALVETELGALLHQLADAVTSRARIPVTVEAAPHCTLPPEVQVALYRIAQEALSNAVKHAGAKQLTVTLRCVSPCLGENISQQAGGVELIVADDGQGFDLNVKTRGSKGLGLGIMRERAAAVGAAFQIQSQPGQGTRITANWPKEN